MISHSRNRSDRHTTTLRELERESRGREDLNEDHCETFKNLNKT